MKHTAQTSRLRKYKAEILAIYFVLAMIVPNVLLDFTEQMPWLAKVLNVVLPASLYLLLTSAIKRPGLAVLCAIPFIALNAFEIVIMYLFGGSIIAIDMFINVVTTTASEATELLANLAVPMAFVIFVYLGMIIWGSISLARHERTSDNYRRKALRIGAVGLLLGISIMIFGQMCNKRFHTDRNLFPYNVCSNIVTAAQRISQSANYHQTSAGYKYDAVDNCALPDSIREVHIVILGETSRAANWQLIGYDRETNPRLSQRDDIVVFNQCVSQSNTTHKCVPMLLSPIEAANFDSIIYTKSIITAFKEAGYHTAFFTTQPKNGSYNQFFGEEADHSEFLDCREVTDAGLVQLLKDEITNTDAPRTFIVLHTYGSHFKYHERYPSEFEHFTPADASDAKRENRAELINAYDNSIRFTDYLLNDVMEFVDSIGAAGTIIYSPDHGEDIFDDSRDRFLHASPSPTYYQIHVPLIVWTSDAYNRTLYPDKINVLRANSHKYVTSPQTLFHTVVDMAGISTPRLDPSKSVASATYTEPDRLYLNDYNEAVPLVESGLKSIDIIQFINRGINPESVLVKNEEIREMR